MDYKTHQSFETLKKKTYAKDIKTKGLGFTKFILIKPKNVIPKIPTSQKNDPSNLAHPKDLKGSIDVDVILLHPNIDSGFQVLILDERKLKKTNKCFN